MVAASIRDRSTVSGAAALSGRIPLHPQCVAWRPETCCRSAVIVQLGATLTVAIAFEDQLVRARPESHASRSILNSSAYSRGQMAKTLPAGTSPNFVRTRQLAALSGYTVATMEPNPS